MTPERFKQIQEWMDNEIEIYTGNEYASLSVPVQNMVKELFNEVVALQWCKDNNCAIEYWEKQLLIAFPLDPDTWIEVEAENLIQGVEKAKEKMKEFD